MERVNKICGKTAMLFLMFISLFTAGAQGAEIAEADSAYNDKDYARAISLYEEVASEKGVSVGLLYNLGNAYFQEGDYGHAMVSYLRAHRLDPSQKEVNANLRYLRSRVEDANKAELKGKRMKVSPDEPSFFESVHTSIATNTSSNVWAVWGAVAFILFIAGAALYIFTRSVAARKVGFFGGILCLFASFLFVIFAAMGARAESARDSGVVVGFKVTLLTEPGKEADANKGGVLTRGSEVDVLSEEVDAEGNVTWYKVRLNSDYIGWIPAAELELV